MFQEYRDRTEANLPYTIITIEDVIFINERKLVSLEQIYFQPDGKYNNIEEVGEDYKNYLSSSSEKSGLVPSTNFINEPKYYKISS